MDKYNQINLSIDWDKLIRDYQHKFSNYRVKEKQKKYQLFTQGNPETPKSLKLRDYQQEAVINWFKNKGRGTLKMATGSGKTITALAIATELYEKIKLQVLLIVCPYRHLVVQWERECKKFNLNPILAFESVYNWQSKLSTELYNVQSYQKPFLTIITTNSTLIKQGFQSQIKFFPEKTLIVGDEAHHLGSPRLESSLPRNIGLRLALSATPERYFDEEGTDALLNYFGEVIKPEFTLADAIKKQALVPYLYYPIFVNLTESEAFTYAKLTQRIGWALGENDNLKNNDNLTSLLIQRSRLIGVAENKLTALRELMKNLLETNYTLFYCGDGYLENEPKNHQKQIAAVTRILGRELGYRVNTYTAENTSEEREKIRQQFKKGDLQGLVSIRCLDEGIDIPEIEQAVILASSGNPHQFIQRRGRVLRPYRQKKQAIIYDMVVLPPDLDRATWEVERNLLRKELKRFVEFAKIAKNAEEASHKFLAIQEQYSL
ncbi:DNA phosphorothioation system restriction enzyme [Crocosphaera sp.]|uniref:DNA phosphorothioation system restriction enzyme n=1 Tax=Crocosphaera sp. TaxID=2729996 RepID=UPI00261BD2E0|nr:DNA phosphorothioation system restriction enzyme [Crocosphaera sp.]MDJ0582212.1 DNA phosphorothioation system restriction enzyme [Crocosphaera sp.]